MNGISLEEAFRAVFYEINEQFSEIKNRLDLLEIKIAAITAKNTAKRKDNDF